MILGFNKRFGFRLRTVLRDKCVCVRSPQETIDPRRQMVLGNQVIDARGRKFTKRVVDIRELNEQAKVIDDLK